MGGPGRNPANTGNVNFSPVGGPSGFGGAQGPSGLNPFQIQPSFGAPHPSQGFGQGPQFYNGGQQNIWQGRNPYSPGIPLSPYNTLPLFG